MMFCKELDNSDIRTAPATKHNVRQLVPSEKNFFTLLLERNTRTVFSKQMSDRIYIVRKYFSLDVAEKNNDHKTFISRTFKILQNRTSCLVATTIFNLAKSRSVEKC